MSWQSGTIAQIVCKRDKCALWVPEKEGCAFRVLAELPKEKNS